MTTLLILAATVAAVSFAYAVVCRSQRDRDAETIQGLRDQLHAEQKAHAQTKGIAAGYHDAPGTHSSGPRFVPQQRRTW